MIEIFKVIQPIKKDWKSDKELTHYKINNSFRYRLEKIYTNNIRNLSIGNICVGEKFMKYLSTDIIPKLYTLELFSIKTNRHERNLNLFDIVYNTLADVDEKFHLIKLRVSGIDLSS